MNKIYFLVFFLIYIPMIYTPIVDIYEYRDYPPFQIKQEKAKEWFVFKERKRYFKRHYA